MKRQRITFEQFVYVAIIGSFVLMMSYPIYSMNSEKTLSCLFKQATGIPCPTCGMTRSFQQLLLGNFIESIHFHIFTIPIYLFYGYLAHKAASSLFRNSYFSISKRVAWSFFVVLILSWGWKFIMGVNYY